MSQPRILRPDSEAYYHAYSRIVDKVMRIGEAEKRYFRSWMRRLERFSGVRVVTYCLMSNHFHLLVRVPEKAKMPPLDEATLRELLPLLYKDRQLLEALQELDAACNAAAQGQSNRLGQVLERYHARRYDLSSFVKELKQRFTQWYNERTGRTGTLWEDRFHSVLVEGSENTLLTMAAYIDLNPIRAALASDPKDYRWSGYAEAVGGGKTARRGLNTILGNTSFGMNRRITWANTGPRYRLLLYGQGEEREADVRTGSQPQPGFRRTEVEKELALGGQLSLAEILRCKVRYFCDGGIFGSESFVDRVFHESDHGEQSRSPRRKSGARPMKGADWGELHVLRDLQKNVFG